VPKRVFGQLCSYDYIMQACSARLLFCYTMHSRCCNRLLQWRHWSKNWGQFTDFWL